jgi:nucleoside 2-deoxyribosyltransferase
MQTCFVIQPFDGGKFDKRFDDVFKPAIESCGMEAYRVDRDPKAHVPIDSIEAGIRSAGVVLADVTLNNPNVWYELGYAFAIGTPVVMVCAKDREGGKYPFDIQHRAIVSYSTDSLSDFTQLQKTISERLTAAMSRGEQMRQMSAAEVLAPTEGLSQAELFVLTGIGGHVMPTSSARPLYSITSDIERMGLTSIGISLGLRRLLSKGLVSISNEPDEQGYPVEHVSLTELGWEWIDKNEHLFIVRRETELRQIRNSIDF